METKEPLRMIRVESRPAWSGKDDHHDTSNKGEEGYGTDEEAFAEAVEEGNEHREDHEGGSSHDGGHDVVHPTVKEMRSA